MFLIQKVTSDLGRTARLQCTEFIATVLLKRHIKDEIYSTLYRF